MLGKLEEARQILAANWRLEFQSKFQKFPEIPEIPGTLYLELIRK